MPAFDYSPHGAQLNMPPCVEVGATARNIKQFGRGAFAPSNIFKNHQMVAANVEPLALPQTPIKPFIPSGWKTNHQQTFKQPITSMAASTTSGPTISNTHAVMPNVWSRNSESWSEPSLHHPAAVEAKNAICECPLRVLKIENIPQGHDNNILSVAQSVGDVQYHRISGSEAVIQYYTATKVDELICLLRQMSFIKHCRTEKQVAQESIAAVLVFSREKPAEYKDVISAMSVFGKFLSVRMYSVSANNTKACAVCVYEDDRNASLAARSSVLLNGVYVTPTLMPIGHQTFCDNRQYTSARSTGVSPVTAFAPKYTFSNTNTSTSATTPPYNSCWNSVDDSDRKFLVSSRPTFPVSVSSGRSVSMNASSESLMSSVNSVYNSSNPVERSAKVAYTIAEPRFCYDQRSNALTNPRVRTSHDATGSSNAINSIGSAGFDSSDTRFGMVDNCLRRNSSFSNELERPYAISRSASDSVSSEDGVCGSTTHTVDSVSSVESSSPTSSVDACKEMFQKYSNSVDFKPRRSSSNSSNCSNEYANHNLGSKKAHDTTNLKHTPSSSSTSSCDTRINLESIDAGTENRKTVMLRNIPNKLAFDDLKKFLDSTSRNAYNFLYLRFDFGNRCNVGYAFISFTHPKHVAKFFKAREGMKWCEYSVNSEKVVDIKFARIQGRDNLIQKFRNSPVMNQEAAFRPRLYYTTGKLAGTEEPFPGPGKTSG